MKNTFKCPKCDSRRIWRLERVAAQDGSVGVGGSYEIKVAAGGSSVAVGHFDAYICAHCRYSELWSQGLESLQHDPRRGIHLFEGTEGESDEASCARAERARAEEERRSDDATRGTEGRLRKELAAAESALGRWPWVRLLVPILVGAGAFAFLDHAIDATKRAEWSIGVALVFAVMFWTGQAADQKRRRGRIAELRERLQPLERADDGPSSRPYR